MKRLGADSVPVVARGGSFTYAQVLAEVADFLGIEAPEGGMLPAPALVEKLDMILAAAQRFIRQLPNETLDKPVRERKRSLGHLANHIFRIPECFVAAAEGGELTYEALTAAPEPWIKTGDDIARFGESIRAQVKTWWMHHPDVECQDRMRTYFGEHTTYEVLERTCWHAGQHVRQIMMVLDDLEIEPEGRLVDEDFAGLPMPKKVWDDE